MKSELKWGWRGGRVPNLVTIGMGLAKKPNKNHLKSKVAESVSTFLGCFRAVLGPWGIAFLQIFVFVMLVMS